MSKLPTFIYARVVNPGEDHETLISGPELSDVDETVVGDNDSVEPIVGRYMLVGTGKVHHTAPRYVEDTKTA